MPETQLVNNSSINFVYRLASTAERWWQRVFCLTLNILRSLFKRQGNSILHEGWQAGFKYHIYIMKQGFKIPTWETQPIMTQGVCVRSEITNECNKTPTWNLSPNVSDSCLAYTWKVNTALATKVSYELSQAVEYTEMWELRMGSSKKRLKWISS